MKSFTRDQETFLESFFQRVIYTSSKENQTIADHFRLPVSQINDWFVRRRKQFKKNVRASVCQKCGPTAGKFV